MVLTSTPLKVARCEEIFTNDTRDNQPQECLTTILLLRARGSAPRLVRGLRADKERQIREGLGHGLHLPP
jgi:hypothetical protein